MPDPDAPPAGGPYRLRIARVLTVQEQTCQVVDGDGTSVLRFAPMFPSPRVERVSPGHLLAIASSAGVEDVGAFYTPLGHVARGVRVRTTGT